MLETIKTVALIISASVAFCAFVVGSIHYISILVKKIKANREKRLLSKNEKKRIEAEKEAMYQAFLEAKKKEGIK